MAARRKSKSSRSRLSEPAECVINLTGDSEISEMTTSRSEGATSRRLSEADDVIDLTVDSPVVRRMVQATRRKTTTSVRRQTAASSAAAEPANLPNNNDTAAEIESATETSSGSLPPKKRNCKEKAPKMDATINVEDNPEDNVVPYLNDSSTGQADPLRAKLLTCAICYEELSTRRKPTSTRCGHVYCAECIDQVLNMTKKCPLCQARITTKSCVKLYF